MVAYRHRDDVVAFRSSRSWKEKLGVERCEKLRARTEERRMREENYEDIPETRETRINREHVRAELPPCDVSGLLFVSYAAAEVAHYLN